MKTHHCRFLLFTLLVMAFLPLRSFAQDDLVDMVRKEMDGYYKDLVKLDKQIVTAEDAERYETRYKNHIKLVESCYGDYTELFRYEKKLFNIYENYLDLHQQIGKRIDELRAEQERQEKLEKLTTKFNRYQEHLDELEQMGNRCVENKRIDSLDIIKKLAEECYVEEAPVEYGANRDFIDEDETLTASWGKIKATYTRISSLQVIKSPIDMTFILEIVGIVAAVVVVVTLISTKIKAAKLTKPKKEKKNKDENIPSI